MNINNYVGIDIGSEEHAASIIQLPSLKSITKHPIENTHKGFKNLTLWLNHNGITKENAVICMEATGVYGEELCYFLHSEGFKVAVDHPLRIKRAFKISGPKTDPVDSKQIAEYAYRFKDQLKYWAPRQDVIEQVKVLLSLREQFVQQRTASSQTLKAYKQKKVQTPLANELLEKNNYDLKDKITAIEKEIKGIIMSNSTFKKYFHLLSSIPGIALLFYSNLLVLTDGFTMQINAKQLSAYLRIAPNKYESGKTIRRPARSGMRGPSKFRKLIHLAARSVRTHNEQFRHYFLRKLAEGKIKKVALNNIANKLIKVICAVIESEQPFIQNYRSINPILLKGNLTKS